ncbi:MAG TPA: MOSC N-terminal beta barrel domain-containing protein [Nodularia sp. (in: cyanobacteria)]|nr:MOSC N-terminal beta barrel domain-containing protein [Nodularia sp. (in: cyanobacteria)]
MPYLAKILLYPIKSLDGVEVEQAKILASGALEYDREFAIFDGQGKFVNGKGNSKIHLIRSQFDILNRTISLETAKEDSPQVFHLDEEQQEIAANLSDFLGFAVTLGQNPVLGFPDDTNSPGPTVISTATLTEVASWFPGLNVDNMRRRIRANIEVSGVPAFWEDQLFSQQGDIVSLRVGDVSLFGVNPCQRCIVPTRNPDSGEADPNFQKIFVQHRKATLPDWADSSYFNHFYRLGVNTRLTPSETGKFCQIGNEIDMITSQM